MYTNAVFEREKENSLFTIRSILVPLHGYAHMFIIPFNYWNSSFHQFSIHVSRVVYYSLRVCESIFIPVELVCVMCIVRSREKLQNDQGQYTEQLNFIGKVVVVFFNETKKNI